MPGRKYTVIHDPFQSTHPRGCDVALIGGLVSVEGVSIHAPARVRHDRDPWPARHWQVSIHAPARVRPARAERPWPWATRFNPRTREGATRWRCSSAQRDRVSIHAPARVRRTATTRAASSSTRFNPRTREGATTAATNRAMARYWFQSTHPRGCDPAVPSGARPGRCFNPRTREGATNAWLIGGDLYVWFQSTHPRGCDCVSISADTRWRKSGICANPLGGRAATTVLLPASGTNGERFPFSSMACGVREPSGDLPVACGSRQKISGPLRSRLGLAPTCSTRASHFAPRW